MRKLKLKIGQTRVWLIIETKLIVRLFSSLSAMLYIEKVNSLKFVTGIFLNVSSHFWNEICAWYISREKYN